MARSELAAQSRVDRQRQKARGRGGAIALHDHRAVMQRRRRLKDADQQIVGELGIERNAALDVVAKADRSLDHDDGAGLLRRQGGRRHHQLLDRVVVADLAIEPPEQPAAAEMDERAADVGLQQHDGREHDVADDVADQPVERLELQAPRQVEQADDRGDADRHLHRARAADELQQLVNHDRDDQDVEHVPPRDGRAAKQFGEALEQLGGVHGAGAEGSYRIGVDLTPARVAGPSRAAWRESKGVGDADHDAPSSRRCGRGRCGRPPSTAAVTAAAVGPVALVGGQRTGGRGHERLARRARPGAAARARRTARGRPAPRRLCCARFAKPRPGSTISWSRGTPYLPRARSTACRSADDLADDVAVLGVRIHVLGPAAGVHQDRGHAARRHQRAQIADRTRSALMSLTIAAPSSSAAAATAAL